VWLGETIEQAELTPAERAKFILTNFSSMNSSKAVDAGGQPPLTP
jgi:hypothetical protein